jgi:hypothetical protein
VRPTRSAGERRVYEALRKGLPDDWRAWHSLRVRDRQGYLGEGDFVLAHPSRGLLALEVKSGRVEQRDGRWFSNGVPLDPAPLTQAHRFVHRLVERLKDARCAPPAYGAAVCFPDAAFDDAPSQDDLAGVTLGASDLPYLRDALPAVMDRALPPPRPRCAEWMERVHAIWGESWVPSLSLGTRAREQDATRLALDDRQLAVLDVLLENGRVLIRGGAGAGKTLVAAEAARREMAAGRKVLLLCSTQPLGKWLALRLVADGVEVHTVAALARAVVQAAGDAALADAAEAGALLRHAAARCEPRWDTVIVDEAQDLQAEAWELVRALSDGKRLWAFHDPGQQFWVDRAVPGDLFATALPLPRGLRCPPGIEALANRAAGSAFDAEALAASRADGTVAFVPSASPGGAAEAVAAEVERLLDGGLAPGDIGIVSLHGQTSKDPALALGTVGPHPVVRADDDAMEERVVADSFLKWKGLERAAIVLAAPPAADHIRLLGVRTYVALTRATLVARVVGAAEEAERFGF